MCKSDILGENEIKSLGENTENINLGMTIIGELHLQSLICLPS